MTPDEIFNERLKLFGTWMNQVATALLAAGSFVPAFQAIFNILPQTADSGLVYGMAVICIVIAGAIHSVGRALLGTLR